MINQLNNEKNCAICGKIFYPTHEWIYKYKDYKSITEWYCSWKCYRSRKIKSRIRRRIHR